MTQPPDQDPYAELDNRADAGELSEEFRKPVRVFLAKRRSSPFPKPTRRYFL